MGAGALGVALGVIALGAAPALAAATWTIASGAVPAGANQTSLRAVSCTGATACMAVGEKTVDPTNWSNGTTLVEHWDGTTWTVLPSPNPPGARRSVLLGVSCTKPTRCTAVGASTPDDGNSYTNLVERWNGTAWKIVKTPNTVAKVNLLYAVSCTSTTSCTAVGSAQPDGSSSTTLVESWNGTAWTIAPSPNVVEADQNGLYGVSCTSTTACTAVGSVRVAGSRNYDTLAEQWNGTAWTITPSLNPSPVSLNGLGAVSCTSATSCTAVGNYYNANLGPGPVTLVEHWNGAAWNVVASPNPPTEMSELSGVSCTTATACTAVGRQSSSNTPMITLVESWNGTVWTVVANPNPAGYDQRGQSQFVGVSCTGAGGCTAIGSSNNYATGGGEKMLIEHSS